MNLGQVRTRMKLAEPEGPRSAVSCRIPVGTNEGILKCTPNCRRPAAPLAPRFNTLWPNTVGVALAPGLLPFARGRECWQNVSA
jgi:hypothetical protein